VLKTPTLTLFHAQIGGFMFMYMYLVTFVCDTFSQCVGISLRQIHSVFVLLPVRKNQADRTNSHINGTQKLIPE